MAGNINAIGDDGLLFRKVFEQGKDRAQISPAVRLHKPTAALDHLLPDFGKTRDQLVGDIGFQAFDPPRSNGLRSDYEAGILR